MRFALLMLVALASVATVISDPYQDPNHNHVFVNLENLVDRLRVEPAKLTDSDFGVVASAVAFCEESMEGISLGTKLSEYLLQDNSKTNSLDFCPNWVDYFRGWTGKPKCSDESVTQVMALLCIADCGLADDPEFVAVVADVLTRDQNWSECSYGAAAVLLLAKRMKKASLEMAKTAITRVCDARYSDDDKLKSLLKDVVEVVLSKLSADDRALVPTNNMYFYFPILLAQSSVVIDKLSAQQQKEFQQLMSVVLTPSEWAVLFGRRFRNSHNDVDYKAVLNALHSSVQSPWDFIYCIFQG